MPIIITYTHGQQEVVQGDNWKKLDEDSPKLGVIYLKSIQDGHKIIVNKTSVAKVEEIPQELWDANIAEQQKRRDEQASADAKRKADAAAATLAHLEAKSLKGRVKKFLGIK